MKASRVAQIRLDHMHGGRVVSLFDVKVRLSGGRWHKVKVCLDSGAHTSLFNVRTMRKLGVSPTRGRKFFLRDGSGGVLQCRKRKAEISVGRLVFPIDAAFSNDFCMDFNILGMDFFELAAVTFDVAGRRIVVTKP